MQIARVALDVPLHRFFDYLVPDGELLTVDPVAVDQDACRTQRELRVMTEIHLTRYTHSP